MLNFEAWDSGSVPRDSAVGDSASEVVRIQVSEDSAPDQIVIPDAQLLVSAKFKKVGSDLTLTGPDGKTIVIEGYYNLLKHPDLVAPGGGGLSADLVERLAVSETAGQYAQVGGAPAGAIAIGRVERLGGSATVQHANGTVSELQIGDTVYQGDIVETRDDSQLGVSFNDGTAFNLGTNARMVLSELVYTASGQTNSGVFNLVKGTMTFVAGQVAKSGDMRIVTPVSTMGIRGTAGQLTVTADAFSNVLNVVYSLMADPDGHIGLFDVLDSAGNIISTIRTTDSTFHVTPQGNQLMSQTLPKTPEIIQAELAAAQVLFPIYLSNPANFIQTPQLQDTQPKAASIHGSSQAFTQFAQETGELAQIKSITVKNGGTSSSSTSSSLMFDIINPEQQIVPPPQLINIDPPSHIVEAAGGSPGAPTSSTQVIKGNLDVATSYDTAALVADKWDDLGNGIYGKLGSYGAAALNTVGVAAATLLAAGWTDVGSGIFEKVAILHDVNGNPFNETVRVNSAAGTLTFALDNAKADPLPSGAIATEQFVVWVKNEDGSTDHGVVTFTIEGTNDAAVVSADVRNLTETNAAAAISTSGTLTVSDIDSAATFQVQTDVNGLYGTFSIAASGAWTYTATSAHNEFAAGVTYTDTFGVLSSDGTATSVTIHILGTNDAAVVSSQTKNLVEGNTAADISTSGALTISDIDSAATFQTQTDISGLYGKFSIVANGAWTYIATSAHDEFATGVTYTDSFGVLSSDGTATSVTIHILGTNDGAVVSGDVRNLTETNAAADISTSGTLTVSDTDSAATFQTQTTVGSFGTFSIAANGAWTYAATSAHDEFAAGVTYTDSFGVLSSDGTATSVTIHILGTNDAALVSSQITDLTEGNTAAAISTFGTLTVSDIDSAATFQTQTDISGLYGKFSIVANGAWTYIATSAHDEFAAGFTYTDTFPVLSSDGTATSVTIHILGTNDAAVVSADIRNLTETNAAAAISASGTLTVSDIDSAATFQLQPGTVGSFGTFSIVASGAWTYTATGAHNEFVAGVTYTDSFGVLSSDGTATLVTIHILGTNDAAVVSTDVRNLTETNAAADISTSGTLTVSDVDSAATFQTQTTVGSFGTFSIVASGAWTYTATSAHNEFAAGVTYTDSFPVLSSDGTATLVTINLLGTNDAAVVSADVRNLTETNAAAAISASGTLTISDVDSAATFQTQTTVGSFGTFSIVASGAWTYTATSAHNEFAAGVTYTDTFGVLSSDGTATSVTIHILGTNDAAVVSSQTKNLVEGNTAADISTSGALTISDIDSAATFQTQTDISGLYGKFSIVANGAWTYIATSAHDEFATGVTYTDSFGVLSSDGTATSVTIHILGTNDGAVVSGDVRNLTETNAAADISTSGTLTVSDTDSAATFQTQTTVGSFGTFSIAANGAWTYAATSAHDEFAAGVTYTDSFGVLSSDGTATSVTIHILGTNDAALVSSQITDLTEGNTAAAISTFGTLTVSDIDSAATFQTQTDISGLYGKFSIVANGAWTYIATSAHDEFAAGFTYTDTFPVLSSDGTATSVTIHILGTNDAAVVSADIRNLTETNAAAAISASGTLTVSDIDSAATFQLQPGTVGSFGTFSIVASGAWTYTATGAHNEFVAGVTYTDSFGVLSSDGTATLVTIHILGTNDAAVVSTDVRNLTETNAAADISTSGTLTVSDVDSAATFQTQTTVGSFGTFSIVASGAWTYTATSAHNEFAAGVTYTDSFPVLSSDGTATLVTINLLGTNDAAVVSADVRNLTETNAAAAISASGTLTISDVDSAATFQTQTTVGSFGTFSIVASGAWTYTATSAHNEFAAGVTYTDTFGVLSSDGTATSVTIHILGTNDAAVVSSQTKNLVEGNTAADISTSGALTISDIDSAATFQTQTDISGLYGKFSIVANGAWTYIATSAHDEFATGVTYTDSFGVLSSDGTATSVTIHILGTNDGAVVSGDVRNLTETNAAADISTSGTLTVSDTDSAATFQTQTTVGSFGTFSIAANGAWTYAATSAHDEFAAGVTYTDSFGVLSSDGTATSVTIHILGTNDAALVSSQITDLTEGNTAAAISTFGTLTVSDIDSAATFQTQTDISGLYGKFSIVANGAWTYIATSAHDEFAAGFTYTDTFPVLSSDGTATSVTIHILGTNDAAVVSADIRNLTETNAAAAISASGTLTVSDIDSAATFQLQPGTVGSFGTFSIVASGAWTYTATGAHNEFVAGVTYTDSFGVLSSDGTATSVTIHILGTNDAAVVSGTLSGTVIEAGVANSGGTPTATGSLASADVDGVANLFQPITTSTSSDHNYGTYTMNASGVWNYTLSNNNVAVNALDDGDFLSDSFTIHTADGTAQVIHISIVGANDGDPTDNDSLATGTSVVFSGNFVFGTPGNDGPIVGGTSGQTIYSGAGNDNIIGSTSGDTIYAGSGNDIVFGNQGADTIFGGSGNDTINGENASDMISGGKGDDLLTGGNGGDTFVFNLKDGHDTITDFVAGLDVVQINTGITLSELLAIIGTSTGDTLNLGNGDAITFQNLDVNHLNAGNFILV